MDDLGPMVTFTGPPETWPGDWPERRWVACEEPERPADDYVCFHLGTCEPCKLAAVAAAAAGLVPLHVPAFVAHGRVHPKE